MIKMKSLYMVGLISASLLIGCGSSSSDNDNDDGKKDNDDSSSSLKSHNQGQACLKCHATTQEPILKSGATVYTLLTAVNGTANIATGHRIQLKLSDGSTLITYTSGNGTGNSHIKPTATTITSADKFTATVINASGSVIKSSEINSHNGGRFDCNACHTAGGLNDAPGRVVNQ